MGILEVRELSFAYPQGEILLKNIDLEFKEGEFSALLGANGCGKTTLFQNLNGLLKPKTGAVYFHTKELTRWKQTEIFERIGMVFQDPNDQLFASTVFEDVAFGPRNLMLPTDEVNQRVRMALDWVGMSEHPTKVLNHLSYGQKKRVAIAGVLAMKPEIIILDEPTAGLDPRTATALMRTLKNLQLEQGMTLIMATHEVDLVPVYCDRVHVMQAGQITLSGTPQEVFAKPKTIRESFLRLPRIAHLWEVLRSKEGLRSKDNPLTIKEAREAYRNMRS